MLCAQAQKAGGTTVWCHNGQGMEMPIGFSLLHVKPRPILVDGLDVDYEHYYRLLNCGFRCPASSGTDWWIYDHNRVFVRVEDGFSDQSTRLSPELRAGTHIRFQWGDCQNCR